MAHHIGVGHWVGSQYVSCDGTGFWDSSRYFVCDGAARFTVGAAVSIQGLKASPEYNGARGILRRFVHTKGRWAVRLAAEPASHPHVTVRSGQLVLLTAMHEVKAVMRTLMSQGQAALQSGDAKGALEKWMDCLACARAQYPPQRQWEAAVCGSLAVALRRLGRLKHAIAHTRRALSIHQALGSRSGARPQSGLRFEAQDRSNLGELYREQGRFREAAVQHERCVRLAEQLGDKALVAAALGELGVALEGMGQYGRATDHHARALAMETELSSAPAPVPMGPPPPPGSGAKPTSAPHDVRKAYIEQQEARLASATTKQLDALLGSERVLVSSPPGCFVALYENVLSTSEASAIFATLRDERSIADGAAHTWRRETDDFGVQQRRSFYAADDECTFRYVGLTLRPRQQTVKAGALGVSAWSPELGAIRDRVDRVTHAILAGRADKLGPGAAAALRAEMSAPQKHRARLLTACLANSYEAGGGSIPWHFDEVRAHGPLRCIATVSLGAERVFELKLRHGGGGDSKTQLAPEIAGKAVRQQLEESGIATENAAESSHISVRLRPGSLLIMAGDDTQRQWFHRVPPPVPAEAVPTNHRISLTFRSIEPRFEDDLERKGTHATSDCIT